ncbi:cytidylate kinase-like family protein [Balneolaceae bacterium ANBcel3]|nr:cytidylate kinase-like family protein [Balneolaceae bacterium ANBcel3]
MYSHLIHKIDRDIAAQLKSLGVGKKRSEKYTYPCITISREFGCEGIPVAQKLSEKLSTPGYPWVIFHRDLISTLTEKEDIKKDLLDAINTETRGLLHQYIDHLLAHKPSDYNVFKKKAETLNILAARGRSIIVGSGAAIITSDIKNTFHVRLQASMEFKVQQVSKLLNMTEKEAREKIEEKYRKRTEYIYNFTRQDVTDPHHYDLVINNSRFNADEIVELIHRSLVLLNMLPQSGDA